MKLTKLILMSILVFASFSLYANEQANDDATDNETGLVELAPNSDSLFKIKIQKLQLSDVAKEITSPGEVVLNAYKTAIVALRIDGQIIKRLVKMGQQVVTGQLLATISSIPMSEAQQAYIVNVKEWRRVKQLGRQVVSGKRFIEARSKWQSSQARLKAYGLDQAQLIQLEKGQTPEGIFQLKSPIDGVVMKDDFIEGQYAAAGTQLFVISDEADIWVEASVSPNQATQFSIGDLADIEHAGERYSGTIIQLSHIISESTRTQKIRIEIDNKKDHLHPGQFVSVRLRQAETEKKLVLPESALVRTLDGDWGVFVEVKPRHFAQKEVKILGRQGNMRIISGLELGTPVVVEGAFYLSAELAKAGFDPHGH